MRTSAVPVRNRLTLLDNAKCCLLRLMLCNARPTCGLLPHALWL